MKARIKIISSLTLVILACLTTSACGMKMKTSGRVVDAMTNQPIEGAAVAIKWVHKKIGVPGLPTPKDRLGTTETLTDAQGNFTIPHYLNRSHSMGVYKKGYICWSSETIFNPYGNVYEEIFQDRFWHRVTDNMTIQLQPIPDDISPELRKRHGCFAGSVRSRTNSIDIFYKAIKHEDKLCFKKSN